MTTNVRVTKVRVDSIQFHAHNVRQDLGDLRPLADSIRRFGVMQPIVVEDYGDTLRLRAGHRRLTAARMAGLPRIPALVHDVALDDDEWLVHSVQENVMRRGLDAEERARAINALRELDCTWEGIGEAFGVTAQTARQWSKTPGPGPDPTAERMDFDRAQVVEKVRQGRSTRQIADELHMTTKRVDRLRERDRTENGTPLVAPTRRGQSSFVVSKRALREVAEAWRSSGATAADLAAALLRLADSGDAADAMPPAQLRSVR